MRLILLAFVLFISSCSLMMPYEEEVACKRGIDEGYCGRISDVYERTLGDSGGFCAFYPELCREE